MDFTGKYSLMCKKASLLQENIKELLPNAYGALYVNENDKIAIHKKKSPEDLNDAGYTWLPRIDEMIAILGWNDAKYVHEMQKCLDNERDFPYIKSLGTLERMTLSIVMFHKFNVEWDNEELKWVDVRMYGIGTDQGDLEKHGWSMLAGPTRDLSELMDLPIHPKSVEEAGDNWYIVNLVKEKSIYKWNNISKTWTLQET